MTVLDFDRQFEALQAAAQAQINAASQAAAVMRETADKNIEFLKEQNEVARADLAPFLAAGQQGISRLNSALNFTGPLGDLLGMNSAAAQEAATQGVLQDAQTQGAVKLGLEAVERQASARGLLDSGNLATALQDRGQTIATQSLGNRINQLLQAKGLEVQGAGQLASLGNQAAGQSANLATNLGQQVAAQNTMAGEAAADGVLAQGAALSSLTLASSPLTNLATEIALLNQDSGGIMGSQFAGGGLLGAFGGQQ